MLDRLLENDRLAGIAAGLLCVVGWIAVGLELVPGAHSESVASVASSAGVFAVAAMRRDKLTRSRSD